MTIESWLKRNKGLINISELEKIIGCPEKTLYQATYGMRKVPKKYQKKLSEWMFCFGMKQAEYFGKYLKSSR